MPTGQVISALLRVSCLYLAKISIGKDKLQDHDWQIYGICLALSNVMLIELSLSFSSRHYELENECTSLTVSWNAIIVHQNLIPIPP